MVFIQTETEESILMRLGTSLYHARRKKGLSQEAVAEKLGVSRQTISKWETDETLPDIRQAKKLSVLYGLTLDELISFDLGHPGPAGNDRHHQRCRDKKCGLDQGLGEKNIRS